MLQAAVIGNPISHSLSPKLHGFLLDKYKISGSYDAIEVKPEDLKESFTKLLFDQNFQGFNVTIPHKESVFKICEENNYIIKDSALLTKSVNTIYKEDEKIVAESSDGFGFVKNLEFNCSKDYIIKKDKKAIIFGAGGAAKSIIPALFDIGFSEFTIINRSQQNARILAEQFYEIGAKFIICDEIDEKSAKNIDLVTNSTSLGMKNQPEIELNMDFFDKNTVFYDIVYNPLMTKFLKNAKNNGNITISGLGMLIFQAFLGFEKWFKIKPELSKSDYQELENHLLSFI